MNLVVGLVLAIALTTVVKLGTRRLFRGRARPEPTAETRATASPGGKTNASAGPKAKPKPTARTNARGQRRR